MKAVVRPAVFKIVAEAVPDHEPQVFVDRDVAVVEEAMEIRAQ